MDPKQYRNNVERWLIHESFSFKDTKSEENSFHILIKHLGSFGNAIEIFQPKKQQEVIVIGSNVPLKNNQNARYLSLTEKERGNFERKIGDFCISIQAIHRFLEEDGKKKVGVYKVLDKEEQFNQKNFIDAITEVSEMSDKTNQFLLKTF